MEMTNDKWYHFALGLSRIKWISRFRELELWCTLGRSLRFALYSTVHVIVIVTVVVTVIVTVIITVIEIVIACAM